MLPHQEFFYAFQDLPATASPAEIRRACPPGFRRQFAFKHFFDLHPEDVRYLEGYLAAYVRNGVYDDTQFTHCFGLIDKGMELKDRAGCRAKLRALRADLERQRAEMLEERGADPPVATNTPWFQFRSGNYAPIISRYAELEASVVPRGILGPPEEKEFWALSQFMIRISLMNGKTEDALTRMRKYENGRVSVKLTPLPDFDIQEAVLGYLASQRLEDAVERLRYWVNNSRMPTVSDVVRNHPAFSHLFATRHT